MNFLSQVKTGKIRQPILMVLYGPDGVGKSTFAASAPKPIFLGTESGTSNLDVARLPAPKTYNEVLEALHELVKEKHDFQTLAIDSLDWMEPLVWEQVCVDNNWKNIEEPGYGKGYVLALQYWQRMLSALTRLRDTRGMNVVAIAHSQVKLSKDPQLQTEYDRYLLKLNEKAAALWREYVDAVGFANFEVFAKTDANTKKTKAFGDGARVLYTERRPGFDAKNRFGLPFKLPLSWEDFFSAYQEGFPENPDEILANIHELIPQVSEDLRPKVLASVERAGKDAQALEKIQDRLRALASTEVA